MLRTYLEQGCGELGVVIEPANIDSFSVFAAELGKWNKKINLTAITRIEEVAVKHFLDSIALLPHLAVDGELLDIGSGGGFPSIPLKIISPGLKILSVDAVEKKINFQRHIARLLRLENFTAVHARGEALAAVYAERFPVIVSRAFADIPKYVQMVMPLLAPCGVIIAMKGRDGRSEAESAAGMLAGFGFAVSEIHEFQLPFSKEMRSLVMIRRISSRKTPDPE